MPSKLVAVDGGLHLPTAVRNQLSVDVQADLTSFLTDAQDAAADSHDAADDAAAAASASAASAVTATAAAASAVSIVTADLDEANALLIADAGSETNDAIVALIGTGAKVVPVWYAGSWPSRPTVGSGDIVLWLGNPTGTAPPGMLAQDVWTRSPSSLDGVWQPYTPVLTAATTNPTLGTASSSTGRYVRTGNTISGNFDITFGTASTNAGSGEYFITLPVNAANSAGKVIGSAWLLGSSAQAVGVVFVVTAGTLRIRLATARTTNSTTPWAWSANHALRGTFTYEV